MIQTEHATRTVLLFYGVIQCNTLCNVSCHVVSIVGGTSSFPADAPRDSYPGQLWQQLVHGIPWIPASSSVNYLFNRGLSCNIVSFCMNHRRHPWRFPRVPVGYSGNTVIDRRSFRGNRGFPCRVTRTLVGSCGRPWVPRETVGTVEDSVRSRGRPSMPVETPAETLGETGDSVGDGVIIPTRDRGRRWWLTSDPIGSCFSCAFLRGLAWGNIGIADCSRWFIWVPVLLWRGISSAPATVSDPWQ